MPTYDEIIAAGTARYLRNARIVGPLEHACQLSDVTPAALARELGWSHTRQRVWSTFGGGHLTETRWIAGIALELIERRWADFPKSTELEAALVALQAAIDDE